jgi:hypothetical protein
MATPGTKPVTLSDGSVGEIPDNLDPASETAFITRLDASNKAAADAKNQQNSNLIAQPGPELFPAAGAYADTIKAAVGSGLSKAGNAITSTPGFGWTGPTANVLANAGADVAALPWDAPASITNAITKTAQNYGYAQGEPDIPYFAPKLKADAGITPTSGQVAPRIENALAIAATGGEGLIPRLLGGAIKEGLSEGGQYAGQKLAQATDPRLDPLFETGGALALTAAPYEQGGSLLSTLIRRRSGGGPGGPGGPGGGGGGTDPGEAHDAAVQMQNDLGLKKPPITLGQVGSPVVQQFEKILGAIPFLGAGVQSAREQAKGAIVDTRNDAAANVGATPTDTTPTAPGSAAFFGTKDFLNDVGQRMDNVESTIANYQRPGGGDTLVDPHGLINTLQGLKTRTDQAGNVYPNVAPEIGSMIDNEVANINSARVPEDQNLHVRLQSDIQGLNNDINNPNTPPQNIPALQAQLNQAAAQMDANLKVPFNVLRQMKTLQSYDVNPQTGMPTLNGHMGGQVLDAYRDTLQNHVNSLDPQLGAQYQDLNGQYKSAADATRAVGNLDEQSTTSMLKRGTAAPSTVQPLAATPVWGEAAGNTLRQMGNNPKGEFVPREFASAWNNMTPAAKALYTQTNPDAARMLNNAGKLAANYDIPPETGGLSKALAMLELFNHGLEHVGFGGTLLGAPGSYIAESAPVVRAVAGRPQPYFQTLSQNLPALAAVAAQQQRNQKQPGSTP